MKIISLDSSSVHDWAEFLPEEMITEMMRPESDIPLFAAGVTFLREPQGAITWEEKEDEWLLRSIYIAPQSRRLGLGSALVSYVSEQMVDKDCEHLSVSYDPQEERKTLTPFLRNCGFAVEPYELSLGVTKLEDVTASLRKYHDFQGDRDCRPLHLLTQNERELCGQWLYEKTGESISRYLGKRPESFVLLRGRAVAGMMLFGEHSGAISLDYCWISPDAKAGFLAMATEAVHSLNEQYPEKTKIEMVLSTDEAQKLYSHLLGEKREQIMVCKGHFSPWGEEMPGI